MSSKPDGEIIKWPNIKYQFHANNNIVYMALKSCGKWDDISSSSSTEASNADICIWMSNSIKQG